MIATATLATWVFSGLYIFGAVSILFIFSAWFMEKMGGRNGEELKQEDQKFKKRITAALCFFLLIGSIHGIVMGIV